jgi:hypothetical protein
MARRSPSPEAATRLADRLYPAIALMNLSILTLTILDNGLWIINYGARNPLVFIRFSLQEPPPEHYAPYSHSIVPGGLLVTS